MIRTEASPEIGMGHLMRCLSLAKMLKQDFEISFLLNRHVPKIDEIISAEGIKCNYLNGEENNADSFYESSDAIVLDGYGFGTEIQEYIKQKNKILVFIDDLHEQHFYADAVINVSDSVTEKEYTAEPNTKFYLGSEYALLRSEFIEAAKKPARKITSVKRICISMGGADVNNITLKILKSIQHISSIEEVHVIIGAVNPHEKELQERAGKINLHRNINVKKW
ncbi:MAG: UDP-2,4-diacetamido-2,4,6-trideoxy-beta-L-altropyranose hydrolase [Sphingobacteriaceae bacterium]|nr:UDP-2,4-diacetamido-2,4,6-trideoxy-beta-L-altropyranose hydrolase [Sphingobacteriaceae bacterium]